MYSFQRHIFTFYISTISVWIVFLPPLFISSERCSNFFSLPCLGCPRNKQTKISFQTVTRSVLVVFLFVSWNQKQNILVCFSFFEPISKQPKQKDYFETNRNSPKFSEKYPNMLSFKLFGLIFCLFRFNWNIENLCFGIEAKQQKQTVLKQTEKNLQKLKNLKFSKKILKYAPYQTVSVGLLFILVQSKHQNSLFGIEAKQLKQTFYFGLCRTLFQFLFRLFGIETSFEGHPSPAWLPILHAWITSQSLIGVPS